MPGCVLCVAQGGLTHLDVAAGGDQQGVIRGEVQVGHPASVEGVHAVFTFPGADLQQRAVPDAPELRRTDRHYTSTTEEIPLNHH